MISLSEAWIILRTGKIFERINQVNSITEENVIIHEDLLSLSFIWVEWHQIAINDSLSTFYGCLQKVIIYFLDGSISLNSLNKAFSWEILNNLEFFIPVSNTLWI
jgi:hypothetical protein